MRNLLKFVRSQDGNLAFPGWEEEWDLQKKNRQLAKECISCLKSMVWNRNFSIFLVTKQHICNKEICVFLERTAAIISNPSSPNSLEVSKTIYLGTLPAEIETEISYL